MTDKIRDVFICDAVRTPIGRYGGSLAKVRTDDLAAVPLKALMARNPKVDWEKIEEVIFGCANQAGEDNRNVARMAALLAGLPVSVPGVTVNRLCASGLNAVGERIDENAFKPQRAKVKAGTTVTWTNTGKEVHDATALDGAWTTGPIKPGASATVTFAKPGVYTYVDKAHPWAYAELTVE